MHPTSTRSELRSPVIEADKGKDGEGREAPHADERAGAAQDLTDAHAPQATAAVAVASPKLLDHEQASPLLELENLYHRWRRSTQPVLDGVSLTLHEGESVWIGGRNGAGKTTLLRLAAGIFLPQRGTIRMGTLTPRSSGAYRRQIGFLSAGDRGLYARLRVSGQLDFWARLCYIPPSERANVVARGLEQFGLEALAGQRVDRLSMGQRQRIRLAMAFMHEPAAVMLDEPRNSLDDDGYRLLSEQVELVRARGATVLWCSPRGEDRVLGSDRGFTLEDGRLEQAS